jgi:tetratricopeptide (TPR) repeat protein
VLPEFGGHIYSATDKLTGGQIFWDNPELKKSLIGLTGAWCAFGVEINFPIRGHTPTTTAPVNYALQSMEDGVSAIVVSDREYMGNMKWTTKILLRPGSPRLEIKTHLYNCTPWSQPLYYWQNAAVRANNNVQFIFPQSKSTSHESPWIKTWPVEDSVDISWYRNHSRTYSRFNRDDLESFMGYYDYGEDFGAFHWADRNQLPFRKFWSWGQGANGKAWNKRLSDTYGDYVELQSGLFKDQETVAFIEPHQSVNVTHYWMPVRRCGGFHYGSLDAALALRVDTTGDKDTVHYGANSYGDFGKGTLKLCLGDSCLASHSVILNPSSFYHFKVPAADIEGELKVELYENDSSLILAHILKTYKKTDDHEIGDIKYHEPEEKDKTPEDYHVQGRYHETRFRKTRAMESYLKGLDKYPNSYMIKKATARLMINRGSPEQAIEYLKSACQHNLKDLEIDYLHGLAYMQLENFEMAHHYFNLCLRAKYNTGACHYHLGTLSALKKDWQRALPHFEQAAYLNPHDLLACEMAAWAHKKAGNLKMSRELAGQVLALDPTSYQATLLLPLETGSVNQKRTILRPEFKQLQFIVGDLVSIGEYRDAYDLLLGAEMFKKNPMYNYYLAWLSNRLQLDAGDYLKQAAECGVAGIFPHTLLDKKVLDYAVQRDSNSASALHLAGIVRLSMGFVDEGKILLHKAVQIENHSEQSDYALFMVNRKLKIDQDTLCSQLKKVLELKPDMQYAAVELSRMGNRSGLSAEQRLEILNKTRKNAAEKSIEELDNAIIITLMEMRNYDEAAQRMKMREFHKWEHGMGMRSYWWYNHILWSWQLFRQGKKTEALEKLESSLKFPANLHADEEDFGLEGFETWYRKGLILKSLGRHTEAAQAFEKSAASSLKRGADQWLRHRYHRLFGALSLRKLGKHKKAAQIIDEYREMHENNGLWGINSAIYLHIAGRRKQARKAVDEFIKNRGLELRSLLAQEYLAGNLLP